MKLRLSVFGVSLIAAVLAITSCHFSGKGSQFPIRNIFYSEEG